MYPNRCDRPNLCIVIGPSYLWLISPGLQLESSSISRLQSQACAARVSWHRFAAYALGHDKHADADDIIVCSFTHD